MNSPPSNPLPNTAVELPGPPGGAREGWGESGGYSARIATQSIATSSYLTWAHVLKVIQRPVGTRLQKFQGLVHPPLSPNPSPPPPGRKGELNSHIWPMLCAGWRSCATGNVQTCREPCFQTDSATVHFEGWPSTVNSPPSNPLPHTAVKSHFECWPSTLNSPPLKTRPHTAVELPGPPGGAREGWGESGDCIVRIAAHSVAT